MNAYRPPSYDGPSYTTKSPAHVDKDLILYARVTSEANPVSEAMEYALADHPGGWMRLAACARHASPDQWFSDGRSDRSNRSRARRTCSLCPVLKPCRAYALALASRGVEVVGVWGGLDEDQRAELTNKPRSKSA